MAWPLPLQEPMIDAVLAEDGHTYSLAAIQGWLDTGSQTSPMTNLPMGTRLQPIMALRAAARAAAALMKE